MVTNDSGRSAHANPTKAFFVSMITRDITLEDSILDLIDNSVDSAWRREGSRPIGLGDDADLSRYRISISTSPERFSIRDNCGGMTLDDAVERAFSFGRRASEQHDEYSIGVYGIGMKRAAFKLGRNIRVRSTYRDTEESQQTFKVPIVVGDWLSNDDPPWDFDIIGDDSLDENGVEIVIDDLTDGTKKAFENRAFVQNLKRTIARDYSIHLNRGLTVLVNDDAVTGLPIKLSRGDEYAPVRVDYEDWVNGERVAVEIIGGMAAPPPESIDPDEVDDGDKRFGWYAACNGRIVLAADKTSVAGWGTQDWPQWHRQYSGFIGIVLFTAANAAVLPLTTTKRSVDVSSEVYLRARLRMRDISKEWIGYTNARKQALDDAKRREVATAVVSIHDVEKRPSISLPRLFPVQTERRANVHYSVPVSRMKKLAKELGSVNMTYREVGLNSFNYTYGDLVGEE